MFGQHAVRARVPCSSLQPPLFHSLHLTVLPTSQVKAVCKRTAALRDNSADHSQTVPRSHVGMSWACPKCTFLNPELYLVCDVCQAERPRGEPADAGLGRPNPGWLCSASRMGDNCGQNHYQRSKRAVLTDFPVALL